MIKNQKKLLYSMILLIIVSFNALYSAEQISLDDYTTQRGITIKIPIYGVIENPSATSLRIVFSYTYELFEIKTVIAGSDYIMKTQLPTLKKYKDLNDGLYKFEIQCNDIDINSSSKLCEIEVEILVDSISSGDIIAKQLFINNNLIDEAQLDYSRINISEPIVIKGFSDGLAQNYPNPFSDGTIFLFTLENSSKVDFNIYSASGIKVLSSSDYVKSQADKLPIFAIYNIHDNGYKESKELNQVLEKGYYQMNFNPSPWALASGTYMMEMKTSKGTYYKKFICVR